MSATQSKPKPAALVKLTKRQSDFFNEKRTLDEIANEFFNGDEDKAKSWAYVKMKEGIIQTEYENGLPTGFYVKTYYQKQKDKLAAIKLQIDDGAFTPVIFKTLDSRMRKDVSKLLKGVTWCCENCGAEIGNKPPASGLFFEGDQIVCPDCDHVLLERTNGGQGGPFGYTYKDKKNKPETFKADRISAQQKEIKHEEIYAELLELVREMEKHYNGLFYQRRLSEDGMNIYKRIKAAIKEAEDNKAEIES